MWLARVAPYTVRLQGVSEDYDGGVRLTIEMDREADGRWIAEALQLPGVMCYGKTREEAISNAERLAIEVIADRITHGEMASTALAVSFSYQMSNWPATKRNVYWPLS